LIQMLSQVQQQNQRLLDMPHTSVPPQTAQEAPGATQPLPPPEVPPRPRPRHSDPRGAMRQRIVALLTAHPGDLTPAEMRDLLGVERSLADTCLDVRFISSLPVMQRLACNS
jgi:hypothetical protein